jgi:isoleucyl-tRNA synthetase
MSGYKNTINLPKTDFPMKAGLAQREPETLAKWEADGLYEKIQERRKDAPLYLLHGWTSLRKRRCAHGHRTEQDSQGLCRRKPHHGWFPRPVCSGVGLPWSA